MWNRAIHNDKVLFVGLPIPPSILNKIIYFKFIKEQISISLTYCNYVFLERVGKFSKVVTEKVTLLYPLIKFIAS